MKPLQGQAVVFLQYRTYHKLGVQRRTKHSVAFSANPAFHPPKAAYMHFAFPTWTQLLLYFAYTAVLIFCGMQRLPGFASWHMFTHIRRVSFDVKTHNGNHEESLNPWHYLPHTYFEMSLEDAIYFLCYLHDCQEIVVNGTLTVWSSTVEPTIYQVIDNVLDDRAVVPGNRHL